MSQTRSMLRRLRKLADALPVDRTIPPANRRKLIRGITAGNSVLESCKAAGLCRRDVYRVLQFAADHPGNASYAAFAEEFAAAKRARLKALGED